MAVRTTTSSRLDPSSGSAGIVADASPSLAASWPDRDARVADKTDGPPLRTPVGGVWDRRPSSRTAVSRCWDPPDAPGGGVRIPDRLPAAAGFQHEPGASQGRQEQQDPEGLRLEHLHRDPSVSDDGLTPRPSPSSRTGQRSMAYRYYPTSPLVGVPRRTGQDGAVGRSPARPRIPMATTTTMPRLISTSPMLNTFANGHAAGSAKTSVSGRRAGSARTTLLEKPATSPRPAVATASAEAGMTPPFATIASRFVAAPTATRMRPGIRRTLRRTVASTARVDAR